MAALAREVAREWTPRAIAAGMDIGYEGEDRLMVAGEKLLLRESLGNLIENALHYAGPGAAITVRVRRELDSRILEVEDNGVGLSEAQRAHVFERF